MSTETDTERSTFGIDSAWGWPIGGAIGGALGAIAFGVLLWLSDPAALRGAIPAVYGFEPAGVVGWLIHVAHGAILGLGFGFLVTRQLVLGALRTDVATDALSGTSLLLRFAAAGFVFGLAIWTILPMLVLPAVSAATASDAAVFSNIVVESLVGHLLFGTILGAVFAVVVDPTDRSARDPFAES